MSLFTRLQAQAQFLGCTRILRATIKSDSAHVAQAKSPAPHIPSLIRDHARDSKLISMTHQSRSAQFAFPLLGFGRQYMTQMRMSALDLPAGRLLKSFRRALM